MNSVLVPKSRIVEAACRNDCLSFFQAMFQILNPGSTLHMNWHLEAMAYHLELVRRGVIKRLIIAAPPRCLKSLMASVAFPAFALGRSPGTRIIGISHNSDLQVRFHNDCRLLINSLLYQRVFPSMTLLKSTETEFHTDAGGYRYAKSAEGGLTGLGGGILILDDFQRPLDVASDVRRTATNNLYYSTIASRVDNQNTGAVIAVGQRLHIDDLTGKLLRSGENWTVLNLPAVAEKDEYIPIGPGRWHLRRMGELLHPEQQSCDYLEILRSSEPEIFAAQYQQSPIPPGGFLIRRDQIQYCDELPPRSSSSAYLQSWDPGQKPGETNARSACLDMLIQDNKYFIAEVVVGQWEYFDLQQLVISRANKQPTAILIEDVGIGTALISTLKQKQLPVVAVKPEGDKTTRLMRHISKFANAQVFLLKTAPSRVELETELFSFPGGQHNDLVDALSQALGYKHIGFEWTDTAQRNYEKCILELGLRGIRF
ncbi:phage terminase large subunit [Bradyrhizobium sp.]|uniref:phage terminase large subunit n=1 Tax=Bradyrhizobium sp. TaxID=376 RepID=UPI003C37D131